MKLKLIFNNIFLQESFYICYRQKGLSKSNLLLERSPLRPEYTIPCLRRSFEEGGCGKTSFAMEKFYVYANR